MKKPAIYRPLGPRRPGKWIAFAASAVLVALLVERGIAVRRHPLAAATFVAPLAQVSDSQFYELLDRKDFLYLATIAFLASPTGSNQTYTSDASWNNVNNKIEAIGGGAGGGGDGSNDSTGAGGGGGGGYSRVGTSDGSSFTFANPGTTTATYRIAATAAGGATGSGFGQDGTPGNQSWFNGTTLAGSTVGANGGGSTNNGGAAGNPVGGLGASTTGATGTLKRSGGAGSPFIGTLNSGGGGGAGGPTGNGGTATSTIGGSADGGVVAGGAVNAAGNSGTEFDGSHGCGSGAGENANSGAGRAGGNYGGGGSGGCSAAGGAGAQGLIVLTWTPQPISLIMFDSAELCVQRLLMVAAS